MNGMLFREVNRTVFQRFTSLPPTVFLNIWTVIWVCFLVCLLMTRVNSLKITWLDSCLWRTLAITIPY